MFIEAHLATPSATSPRPQFINSTLFWHGDVNLTLPMVDQLLDQGVDQSAHLIRQRMPISPKESFLHAFVKIACDDKTDPRLLYQVLVDTESAAAKMNTQKLQSLSNGIGIVYWCASGLVASGNAPIWYTRLAQEGYNLLVHRPEKPVFHRWISPRKITIALDVDATRYRFVARTDAKKVARSLHGPAFFVNSFSVTEDIRQVITPAKGDLSRKAIEELIGVNFDVLTKEGFSVVLLHAPTGQTIPHAKWP
jgi:hypothetical protein